MPLPGKFSESYIVLLDGKILGRVLDSDAEEFIDKLRLLKATGQERVNPCFLLNYNVSL